MLGMNAFFRIRSELHSMHGLVSHGIQTICYNFVIMIITNLKIYAETIFKIVNINEDQTYFGGIL